MGPNIIEVSYSGNDSTKKYLTKLKGTKWAKILAKYGEMGVKALQEATPKRSGLTANSWSYEITMPEPGRLQLFFTNSNVINEWANVAVLIQYGHATGTGGWVEGIDYINPALKPIFDKIAQKCWKEIEES